MVTPVTLPQVDNAPILQAYVVHAQFALRQLQQTLGDGNAQPLTIDSLESTGPRAPGTGELQTQYQASQDQADLFQTDLNSFDADIADIAAKSAGVADAAQRQFLSLVDRISSIVNAQQALGVKLSVEQQLHAIGLIHDALGDAHQAVADAHNQLNIHAGNVIGSSTDGSPAGSPSMGSYPGLAGMGLPASFGGGGQPDVSADSSERERAPRGGPTRALPFAPGQQVHVNDIYQYLITKYGFTPQQAAGILGNMQSESSFDTGAFNAGEGAIGLCQWEGGRRTALEHFAASQGKSAGDWQVQVDYLMYEMHGSHSFAYAQVKAAQTPTAAAAAFDQYFEQSSGSTHLQREANAEHIYSSLTSAVV
ncbi:phage tail tip lysozyme [Nocardia tengchongensis]|uniref:phage tail tip lysozyme n=1 Tax=Nocardia tengchongensis TaxID=2055889 RepID=UPI0036891916